MDSFTVQALTQNALKDFECMGGFWEVLLMFLKRNKISSSSATNESKNQASLGATEKSKKKKKLKKSLSFKEGLPRVRLIPMDSRDDDYEPSCSGTHVFRDISPEDQQLVRHFLDPNSFERLERDRERAANKSLPLEAKYITEDILDPKNSETLRAALENAKRLRLNDLIKDFVKNTGDISMLQYLKLESDS